MDSLSFSIPNNGLIKIDITIYSFNDKDLRSVNLVLDTGASVTSINSKVLSHLGYDISNPKDKVEFLTAGGYVENGFIELSRLTVFGKEFENINVGVIDFPEDEYIDGLLGIDILSNFDISIKYSNRKINIKPIENQLTLITP